MLQIALIYLAAAIVAIPIAKRLGLGSVLGYLLAGKLFSEHDEESLHKLAHLWGDDRSYGIAVKQRLEDLKQVLTDDKQQQQQLNACKEQQGDLNKSATPASAKGESNA